MIVSLQAEVEKNWDNILQEVYKNNVPVACMLEQGDIMCINHGCLYLRFSKYKKFHENKVKDNTDLIEKAIMKVMDEDLGVVVYERPPEIKRKDD